MTEPTSESREPIDVEEFIADGFKDAIATFGVTNPDDLPADDPRVKAWYVPYDSWVRVQQKKAADIGTPEADLEMSLKVTPFLVDAGFTDPAYVEEVANDLLDQDWARARDAGLDELAARIEDKIHQLQGLLPTKD